MNEGLPSRPAAGPEDPSSPLPQVPDHELLRRIGSGSYGEVWLARSVMGTYRAVKVVHRRTFDNARPFEREFRGIQRFEPVSRLHDGLVDILQVGRNDRAGHFYYVMELADPVGLETTEAAHGENELANAGQRGHKPGQSDPQLRYARLPAFASSYQPHTLASELQRRGRLPFDECLPLFLSLTSGLGHLHQHGLIHRDIKPSNIIFVNGVAKLADIGLVAEQGESKSYVGTEGYIPPEGPGTKQADLYSLGKLFYEIATGNDRTKFPTLPIELSDFAASKGLLELNAVFTKACANDACHRYRSAEEMQSDLALLQSGKSVKRMRVIERRLAQATRLGAVVAVLFALVLVAYLFSERQRRIVRENYDRAEVQRLRAEHAEHDAREKLWGAYLAQAQARRRTGQAGQRLESLEAVRLAAALRPSLELRNEAIASLALADLRAVPLADLHGGKPQFVAFDESLERFVRVNADGAVTMCRVLDGAPLMQLPGRISVGGLSAAFTADGEFLALYHPHGRLLVWSLARRELALQSPHDQALLFCEFTPDNRLCVAGYSSGELVFRDLNTGQTNRAFAAGVRPDRFSFSRDGRKLVAFSTSSSRGKVLDAQDGRVLQEISHPREMLAAVWSPEARWLATESLDGSLFLWNSVTNRELQAGYRGGMNDGVFLGSERLLASLSWDGTARLWDTHTGRQLVRIAGGGRFPKFNASTRRLGWNRFDGEQLELYEVVWPAVVHTFKDSAPEPPRPINFTDFSPDERWLVSGEYDGVWCWELSSGRLLAHLPMRNTSSVFFPPGDTGLLTCGWSGLLRWPITRGADEIELGPPEAAAPALSAPNMFVAAGLRGRDEVFTTIHQGPIRGYRAGTNYLQLTSSEYFTSIATSADGRWVAAGHWNRGGVRLWDAQTGRVARDFRTSGSSHAGFTPDNRWLIIGALDEYAFWELATGERGLRIPRDQAATIWGPMAFSPDGRLMAIARSRWLVQLLEAGTGREIASLEAPHEQAINWLAFSPSGTRLAVASDAVHVWDLRRLRAELAELKLDWDQPPFPPVAATGLDAPLRVKVLRASAKP